MSDAIARHAHPLPRPEIETLLATKERIMRRTLTAPPSAGAFDVIIRSGTSIAALRSILDPNAPGVAEALSWVARAAASLFALDGPLDVAGPLAWQRGFQAAMVVRDRDALQVLAAASLASIRATSTRVPEYGYLHIDALQAFVRRDGDVPDRLLTALKRADPADADLRDYILDVVCREMELLYRLMTREQAALTTALRKGVEDHARYWKQGARKSDELGQLAMGLLAVCCAAHDEGLAIEVESEYLPRGLIVGQLRAG